MQASGWITWEIRMPADGIRKLDRVLTEVLPRSALAPGLREQDALSAWPDIVGPAIAGHSTAIALAQGVLLIAVDSSVWAQELSMLRPKILAAFDERLGPGHVRNLRFQSRHQTPLPDRRG